MADQTTVARPGADSYKPDTSHVYHDAVPTKPGEAHPTKAVVAAATETHVQSGVLPGLHIDGAETHTPPPEPPQHNFAPPTHPGDAPAPAPHAEAPAAAPAAGSDHKPSFWDTAGTVASDLEHGFVDEVTQHPLRALGYAAAGLAIGVAAIAAAPVLAAAGVGAGVIAAVGTGIEIAGAAGAVGLAVDAGVHVASTAHDASILGNPDAHSAADIAAAHADLRATGGHAADITAGFAGAALAPGAVELASSMLSDGAATSGAGLAARVAPGSDGPPPGAPAAPEVNANTTVGDAGAIKPVGASAPVDAPQTTVQDTQNLFRANADDGGLTPSVKRTDYNVTFEKLPEGTVVKTIESVKAGTPGEVTQPGDWIATRLNPDGTPNLEDGVQNSWPIPGSKIAGKYNINADDLLTNDTLTASPRAGGAVHMVQLPSDTTIMTGRGPLAGHTGDWLANYDYDAATGTPGTDYAIVSNPTYQATYTPVKPTEG